MEIQIDEKQTQYFTTLAKRRLQEVTDIAATAIADQSYKVARSRGTNGKELEITASDVSEGYLNWLRLGSRRGSIVLRVVNVLVTIMLFCSPILYSRVTSATSEEAEILWLLATAVVAIAGIVGLTVVTIFVRK